MVFFCGRELTLLFGIIVQKCWNLRMALSRSEQRRGRGFTKFHRESLVDRIVVKGIHSEKRLEVKVLDYWWI